MEIQPGVGVALVRLGESRADVEARLGAPRSRRGDRAFHDGQTPTLVIDYDAAGVVELIEVPRSGVREHEAVLGDVQLTGRALDDVSSDLQEAGHTGRPSDIGLDFPSGFAIWSMGSMTLADVDPSADPDDERQVVEGVSVGAPAYFGF